MDYTKLMLLFFFVIYSTIFISLFTNNSKIHSYIIIPIVIALQVKYYFGNIIKNYTITKDIMFIITTVGLIMLTVYITNLTIPNIKQVVMPYINKISKGFHK